MQHCQFFYKSKIKKGKFTHLGGSSVKSLPIETKIYMAGNLADIITCAKFQDEIFRGYDFTGGRISHFPIDFRMGFTTVQRDCAACDYRYVFTLYSNVL